jgi:hypothetical protein
MVRARAGEDADWRSYWASLTFEGLAASDDAPAEEPAARH